MYSWLSRLRVVVRTPAQAVSRFGDRGPWRRAVGFRQSGEVGLPLLPLTGNGYGIVPSRIAVGSGAGSLSTVGRAGRKCKVGCSFHVGRWVGKTGSRARSTGAAALDCTGRRPVGGKTERRTVGRWSGWSVLSTVLRRSQRRETERQEEVVACWFRATGYGLMIM